MKRWSDVWWTLIVLMSIGRGAAAQAPGGDSSRQSPSDAWWTGPLLANSAATLPRGHVLVESYLYDVITRSAFDAGGARRPVPRADSFNSQSYILYGVVDRLTVGLVPNFGFNTGGDVARSSRIGVGDLGAMVQWRLTANDPFRTMPTISVNVQETLPTGKHDQLGAHPADGLGSGAYATTFAVYAQKYFWLPNGRILRSRLDISQTFSGTATVRDASVYGTDDGFRGEAKPGQSLYVDAAWEYSITRRWVAALDATYRHARSTEVKGCGASAAVCTSSSPSIVSTSAPADALGLAPAAEYNFSGNVGVILGARILVAGRNASASITPAIAINVVR